MDDALDELASDAGVERGDEAQPQAGEVRRQHGHRDHPDAELPLGRVHAHDVRIGDLVGAANLVDAVLGGGQLERRDQVRQHVVDRRLAAPAR